mgnify:FL=1
MRITSDNKRFITEAGKEILFNGINFVCKEKDKGYLFADHKRLFKSFADKGFNLVRLGIFWDAVEPQPGEYDMSYLQKISDVITDAKTEGLYVIVDMHQDLWSVEYGDGAPKWATITDGAFHPNDCAMWFDAYLRSDAIINAADHFWKNDKADDGKGLMDHYADMWREIVKFLEKHENIIGYEPMNEPFMGSLARNTFGLAGMKTKEKYPDFDFMTMQGITPESQAYMSAIINKEFVKWDEDVLMSFYRRIQQAVSPFTEKALVTGGNIYSSAAFDSGISRLESKDGDIWQIYAPHGYDSVVDSDNYENFSQENVIHIFEDKRKTQEKLNIPVVVGEWGAFPSKDFTNTLIEQMNLILEKYLWSSTYWQYLPGMENDKNYDALKRAYPVEISGSLCSYHYNRDEKQLYVEWDGLDLLCYVPFKTFESDNSDEISVKTVKQMDSAAYIMIEPQSKGRHRICISGN